MLRSGKRFNKVFNNETEEDENQENDELINVINNHVYFYSDVNPKSALKLNMILKKLELELLTHNIKYDSECNIPIILHINSEGGEIDSAISVVDTITSSKIPVHSLVEGIACSAATLISVVCHKRIINSNAQMMIHQLSCEGLWGKMVEIEQEVKNLKSSMNVIKNIYTKYTNIQMDKLNKILKKDINWSSDKCKKFGLVDEIR